MNYEHIIRKIKDALKDLILFDAAITNNGNNCRCSNTNELLIEEIGS